MQWDRFKVRRDDVVPAVNALPICGAKGLVMSNHLRRLKVRNFRSLANVDVEIGPINILFGPNGVGKSSFLDTVWFVRDCAIRSVELASSARSHGIGILYDGADETEPISICLSTAQVDYELSIALSSGRIEPYVGERLYSSRRHKILIERRAGSDKAFFFHSGMMEAFPVTLREPQKLSMGRYLDFETRVEEAEELDRLLRFVHYYHSRSFFLYRLKQTGSEVSHEHWLWDRAENMWSVLRNLHDRQNVDDRYNTIMKFMSRSFPSFDGVLLEQTGPSSVYGSFLEKGRRKPIRASGASDGHLQLLILLVALFSEGQNRDSMMLLDEPEISLHPWALAVFAEAVIHATKEWNKQVFIATHSPVLLSQFRAEDTLAMEVIEGKTQLRRLSEIHEIRDLLAQYAAGSLYEAQAIAPQRQDISELSELGR